MNCWVRGRVEAELQVVKSRLGVKEIGSLVLNDDIFRVESFYSSFVLPGRYSAARGRRKRGFFEKLQAGFLNNSDEIADKSRLAEGCPISAME